MANKILIEVGTEILWAEPSGTHDYDLDLDGLTNNSARQGEKGDLGVNRAPEYAAIVTLDFGIAPTDGEKVHIFWAASPHATAATENPGGTTGSDAAYSDPDDDTKQLAHIGEFVCIATTADQRQVFRFSPTCRYGMPVIWNEAGQSMASAGNGSFKLVPIEPEIQ